MIESIARSYALRLFGIGSTAIAVRVPYAPQKDPFFCRYFSIVGCMSQPPSGLRQPLPIGTYWWFIMLATHLRCLDMKLTPASKFIPTTPHNDGAMTIKVYK